MDDKTFFRALGMQAALAQGIRDDLVDQRATAYAGRIEAFARQGTGMPPSRPWLPAKRDKLET